MHHRPCRDDPWPFLVSTKGMCHKYNRDYYFLCPYCYETTFLNPLLSRHIIPDRSHIVTVVITCDLTLNHIRIRAYSRDHDKITDCFSLLHFVIKKTKTGLVNSYHRCTFSLVRNRAGHSTTARLKPGRVCSFAIRVRPILDGDT